LHPVHLSVQEVTVTVATVRLEFRIDPQGKADIERAAELTGEPATAFARTAAKERAERVLREHAATTLVPSRYFDDLIMWLDEPATPITSLAAAFSTLRSLQTA
jgi:uncharacterized protein (DUF1778 family)